MQLEFLPDSTPILVSLIGKLPSMSCAISRAPLISNSPTSLPTHLSSSSLTLMLIMEGIQTMASPLEGMWSRLGQEQSLGVPSCSLLLLCPPLKQSMFLLLRLERRSSGCASLWGSLVTDPLAHLCSGWTINQPLQ